MRLDEAEATLREIREATGLRISEALKQGLQSLKHHVRNASLQRPYDLYERLNLGAGGYALRKRGAAWQRRLVRSCANDPGRYRALVALFDPQDEQHNRCRKTLKGIREPILTTTPVLTEAFHMLGPASIGSNRLREFVEAGGLSVRFLYSAWLTRAFELMEVYADHPMDLADA